MPILRFDHGTLVLEDLGDAGPLVEDLCVLDRRIGMHRARAASYAEICRRLHGKVTYQDEARAYEVLELVEKDPRPLRPYQEAALAAWQAGHRQGVVVLPTGAGKTYVALRAILACQRSTLVLAPTIDLVHQWANDLEQRLGCPIGRYGGGDRILLPLTVATYDSAILIMPFHGNRFGLVVFDECHHVPAEMTSSAAEACLAPFRLGLTATPERVDGGHQRLERLIGPEVHRSHIADLEGRFLASYQVVTISVALEADEAKAYRETRGIYLEFVRRLRIDFSRPGAWGQFLAAASRDAEGRVVLKAYREQKRLSRASRGKIRAVWELLQDHPGERCLVFTEDNHTAYAIGRRMVLPVITHHTRGSERKAMLDGFRSGALPILVTSKVLNEGIDVPEAAIGIVVSGSGSVREHVQRLGRILRPGLGKVAILYEIVSAGTGEESTSERRRSHAAFGQEPEMEFGATGPGAEVEGAPDDFIGDAVESAELEGWSAEGDATC